jgi:hypothetical protein
LRILDDDPQLMQWMMPQERLRVLMSTAARSNSDAPPRIQRA